MNIKIRLLRQALVAWSIFIFLIPSSHVLAQEKWGQCSWVKVGTLNSHSPAIGSWCPKGTFMVGFDLDADMKMSAHDSPGVGQARCCTLASAPQNAWRSCQWVDVEKAGVKSHVLGPLKVMSWGHHGAPKEPLW